MQIMKSLLPGCRVLILLSVCACSKMGLLGGDVCSRMDDIEFKNYCYEHFDSNGDGKVSKDEAESVHTIGVTYYDIYSLKGIEYFKNLKVLYCNRTRITSLDVSKNTQLVELNCCACNISSLDISKNIQLEELACIGCGLKTLDVSKNTRLTRLDCQYNQLTSLDLSSLSRLIRWNTIGNLLGNQEQILTVFDRKEYWKNSIQGSYPLSNGNTEWKYWCCRNRRNRCTEIKRNCREFF